MTIEIKKSKNPVKYEYAINFMEKRLSDIEEYHQEDLFWLLEHEDLYTAGTTYKEEEIIDKSINIEFINSSNEILIQSDKEQLSRVFFNLIKNSIESIHQKSEKNHNFDKKISVEIFIKDKQINIILIDNGIGFGSFKNNIRDILNPYFTTKKNGTGLGLSIVNKIINDHNGIIKFVSINDGAKVEINFDLNDNRNINS